MPSLLSVEHILSQSSVSENTSRYRYSEDEDERLIIDEVLNSRTIDAIRIHIDSIIRRPLLVDMKGCD